MGSGTSTPTLGTSGGYSIENTEERGITIPQLRQIMDVIVKRCKKEKWTRSSFDKSGNVTPLTPDIVNLYDIRYQRTYYKKIYC